MFFLTLVDHVVEVEVHFFFQIVAVVIGLWLLDFLFFSLAWLHMELGTVELGYPLL